MVSRARRVRPARADGRPPVVAALAVHPGRAAGSRLRILQFRPAIEAAGIELRFWSFISDREEQTWLGGSWRLRAVAVLRGVCRLANLPAVLRHASVVVIHREVVPFGPPVVEFLAKRGRRLVWDVDDAVWEHHTSIRWLPRWFRSTGDKYRRLAEAADEVWAGSETLAAWCRCHNAHVMVTPTVVDVPPLIEPDSDGASVAWIGSPTTAPFVEAILPPLTRIQPPPRVLVVGGHPAIPAGLDADVLDWSPEAERRALAEAQVGLYPVHRRHRLAEGKCGLKAILYMAHGVVPVVTPTTTNAMIVQDGISGRHANDDSEWATAVADLLADERERQRLRKAGHAHVSENYSLATWAPRIVERLRRLIGSTTDDTAYDQSDPAAATKSPPCTQTRP